MPAPNSNIATIVVNGQSYSFWESVIVERTFLEPISYATFISAEFGPTNQGFQGLKIGGGDKGQVFLAGQLAASGTVDTRQVVATGTTHQVMIRIHSNVQDIASSTVTNSPGQYTNQAFSPIANAVANPMGVTVKVTGSADKVFKRVSEHPGETRLDFINRLASMRGLFSVDDASGNTLNFWDGASGGGGGANFTLTQGQNILAVRSIQQLDIDVGQVGANGQQPGDDEINMSQSQDVSATVQNPSPSSENAARRTAIFPMPMAGDKVDAKTYATYQMILNQFKTFEAIVTVPGWTAPDGQLWLSHLGPPATTIVLNSPMVWPTRLTQTSAAPLSLKSVKSTQTAEGGGAEAGSVTELTLCNTFGLGGETHLGNL